MNDNGGEVDVGTDTFELFKILDRSDRKRMARTSALDSVRENASLREWTGFPGEAVGIGHNGGGDALVLTVGAEGPDQLHVWDHETGHLEYVGPPDELF